MNKNSKAPNWDSFVQKRKNIVIYLVSQKKLVERWLAIYNIDEYKQQGVDVNNPELSLGHDFLNKHNLKYCFLEFDYRKDYDFLDNGFYADKLNIVHNISFKQIEDIVSFLDKNSIDTSLFRLPHNYPEYPLGW